MSFTAKQIATIQQSQLAARHRTSNLLRSIGYSNINTIYNMKAFICEQTVPMK